MKKKNEKKKDNFLIHTSKYHLSKKICQRNFARVHGAYYVYPIFVEANNQR